MITVRYQTYSKLLDRSFIDSKQVKNMADFNLFNLAVFSGGAEVLSVESCQDSEYLGSYSVPDGYIGKRAVAHVVFYDGHLFDVFPHGFHKSPFLPMRFVDSVEALWHIRNHPNGKKYYR